VPQTPFPPDCADGTCRRCHSCYSHYVSEKMSGGLDETAPLPMNDVLLAWSRLSVAPWTPTDEERIEIAAAGSDANGNGPFTSLPESTHRIWWDMVPDALHPIRAVSLNPITFAMRAKAAEIRGRRRFEKVRVHSSGPLAHGAEARRPAILREAIADAHMRMATNRAPAYRAEQQRKIDAWLEELTKIYEADPGAWVRVRHD